MRDPGGDGSVLYLYCTSSNILAVILYYRFARCYHWGRRKVWQPTPVFLPGEFHGQKSLVDYSPWDRKELDMTEHTHTHKIDMTKNFTSYFLTVNCNMKRSIFKENKSVLNFLPRDLSCEFLGG